jgi:Zn-dependent protease
MPADLNTANLAIIFGAILVSAIIHEIMHGVMALWLGDTTAQDAGRLTLNPLKHIDMLTTILLPLFMVLVHGPLIFAAKPVPFNPDRVKHEEFGAALVGLAGPFTNLALAGIGAGLAHVITGNSAITNALIIFVEVNVAFFVFNMLPIPPLDGSRLIYALVPEPVQEAMQRFESLGFIPLLIILVVLLPLLSPFLALANQAILQALL